MSQRGRAGRGFPGTPARGEQNGLRAELVEKLGDDRRSSRCGDDDEEGISGWSAVILNLQSRSFKLMRHVASSSVKNPGLWPKSRAMRRGERGAQSLAREGSDDVIDFQW